MSNINVTIRMDENVKKQADELFNDLGFNLSTAINIFLRQAIREDRIPFNIQREIPNADTVAAMLEVEELSKHPQQYKRYSSFAELLQEVETDA